MPVHPHLGAHHHSALLQAGTPLSDDDRWPWLQQLAGIVQRHLAAGQPAVLSCSALKPAYRALLRTGRRSEDDGGGSSGCSSGGGGSRWAEDSRVAFVSAAAAAAAAAACQMGRPAVGSWCRQRLPGSRRGRLRDLWPCLPANQSNGTQRCSRCLCTQHLPPLVPQVLLDPPREVLERRLVERATAGAHFMPASLLDSQLAALQWEEGELFLRVAPGGGGEAWPQARQVVDAIARHLPPGGE